MVRAFLRHYANSEYHEVQYARLQRLFEHTIEDWNESIFDSEPSLLLDEHPPVIQLDDVRYQAETVEIEFAVLDDVTGVLISDDLATNGARVYVNAPRPMLAPIQYNAYVPATLA